MLLPVFEGIIFSFVFLLVCVIDIQNGPVGGVHFYEKDVQDRVVELGLISREEIRKKLMLSGAVLWLFLIFIMPLAVFLVLGWSYKGVVDSGNRGSDAVYSQIRVYKEMGRHNDRISDPGCNSFLGIFIDTLINMNSVLASAYVILKAEF